MLTDMHVIKVLITGVPLSHLPGAEAPPLPPSLPPGHQARQHLPGTRRLLQAGRLRALRLAGPGARGGYRGGRQVPRTGAHGGALWEASRHLQVGRL